MDEKRSSRSRMLGDLVAVAACSLVVFTLASHYQLRRLDGLPEVFSSPVGASGRVYITGRDGVTHVIRHGSAYELLAKNKLEDGFDASPALVDNAIYLRGYQTLYCIASPD